VSKFPAILILLLCTLVMVAPMTPAATPTAPIRVVVLGDSVASGLNCDCKPFPHTYAKLIRKKLHRRVAIKNYGISGLTAANLLNKLNHDSQLANDTARANIVIVQIGANDLGSRWNAVNNGACQPANQDCFPRDLAELRSRIEAILNRITQLRNGVVRRVLVTGYWNVFEDGPMTYDELGQGFVTRSRNLTRQANQAIFAGAQSGQALYVDLVGPFFAAGGPRLAGLLGDDGDHPNKAGQAVIAKALTKATTR